MKPLRFFVFTRLMFGFRAAATIAKFGLLRISAFGESCCKHCGGRYSNSFPESSKGRRCFGISHMFAQIANRSYVDDMIIPGHSKSIVDSLVNYGKELLSMFSYEFKDTDMSHQQDRTSTKTLDQEGNLAVCGYLWHPSSDKFQIKPSYFTNGTKDRGKIVPTQAAEFLLDTITRPEQMTREHVDHILADVTKTLRLIVSLASRPYDTLGLCNCLISQIRHTVSLAMGLAQGDWNFEVSEEL